MTLYRPGSSVRGNGAKVSTHSLRPGHAGGACTGAVSMQAVDFAPCTGHRLTSTRTSCPPASSARRPPHMYQTVHARPTHPSGRRVRPTTRGDTIMTLTSATSMTQAVVNHHLERFAALDLQGVVADYAPDAVMIVPTGVLRGVQEITPLFANLVAEFAKPGATFDLQQQVIE